MKKHKSALFILLLVALLVLFASSDLGIVEIENNAIITAIAIDKEQDKYAITAQIALPEAVASSAKNEKTVLSAKGNTVSEAIKQSGSTTGWYPKLSFCNLILVGKDVLSDNVIEYLDYFANTLKIQYSTIVAGCDGKASDFLKKTTPLDSLTSFSIQKILLQGVGHTQNCVDVDIKTFTSACYSKNKSAYLPYIKMIELSSENGNDQFSSGGSGSSSNQSAEDSKQVVFDATTTLIFKDGYPVGELNEKETHVFNYLTRKLNKSYYTINNVVIGNESADYLLAVLDNNYKVNFNLKNGTPVLDVCCDMYVRIDDQNGNNNYISLTEKLSLPDEVKLSAEEDFNKNLTTLFNKCRDLKVDLFNVTEELYRNHQNRYHELKGSVLSLVTLNANITFHGQSR